MDIHEAAGTYDGKGLRGIKGAKGILYLEKEVQAGKIKIGTGALKDILHNHVVLSFDAGLIVEVTGSVIAATMTNDGIEADVAFFDLPSGSKYDDVDPYVDQKQKEMEYLQPDMEELKTNHGKTVDPVAYEEHLKAFEKYGKKIHGFNSKRKNKKRANRKNRKKQGHYMKQALKALQMACAIMKDKRPGINGAPIILWGNPTFNPCMKGFRATAPKKLIKFFSKYFLIIMVNEHMSSQNCPNCLEKLVLMPNSRTRKWRCDRGCKMNNKPRGEDVQGQDQLVVNKDKSATCNFFTIFCCLMVTGKRPKKFIPY